MPRRDELTSIGRIEACERIFCKAASKFAATDTTPEEIAIAATLSAFNFVGLITRDPVAAVEYMRTLIDVRERSITSIDGPAQ